MVVLLRVADDTSSGVQDSLELVGEGLGCKSDGEGSKSGAECLSDGLLPRCQSSYRRHHSSEMAMLCILSDALTAADNCQVTLMATLNLSAAFDC